MRWITAGLFLVLLVWLLWVFNGFSNRRMALEIFRVYTVLAFLCCLFIATVRTADCISAERREGTLGFLFLTNLNSAEIIAGKLCSSALAAVYGLMAIFPMVALPLLMGGISFGHFGHTVVGLLNGILFGLASGFLCSVICKKQFTAIALALGVSFFVSGGLILGAAAANAYPPTRPVAGSIAALSPLYTVLAADGARFLGANLFWRSTFTVAGISAAGLALTTLLLALTWRDRPETKLRARLKFGRGSERNPSAGRARFRRRLLAINPLFWLGGRRVVSAPIFMLIAVVLTLAAAYVEAPLFGRIMSVGIASPVFGHLFAWLWTGLAIHALVLYYAAMVASQRLAEDKQAGALELILCTPTSEKAISRGLWLAFARKMLFPAVLAVLVHIFFIWICLVMACLDPPGGDLPQWATPSEIFWSAILNRPLRGQFVDWEFGFLIRCGLLILLLIILTWPTVGAVGRWLGLRMKHPGFAPITALAILSVPPVLLFTLACYVADKINLNRMPERQFLPLMMWVGFCIGVGHCSILFAWATIRLRHQLRAVAMSRYQPLPPWRWRMPSRRTVRRFAIATGAAAAVLVALVASYYGYQNWRATRDWKRYESSLKQTGQNLDVRAFLPRLAADSENFAHSAVFQGFIHKPNTGRTDLAAKMRSWPAVVSEGYAPMIFMEWTRQTPSPLLPLFQLTPQKSGQSVEATRHGEATTILTFLDSHSKMLEELAAAAARYPVFQVSTNRDATAVIQAQNAEVLMLERLHFVFQIRACALLAVGRTAEAAHDVRTGILLAHLARQLPDTYSLRRVQLLTGHSLQPLWEGLSRHAWTEPQLAQFQEELARFNLLPDYTNAIRRAVVAHFDVWRAAADGGNPQLAQLASIKSREMGFAWELQPRGWWLDSCIQLDHAARNLLGQVDVVGERIGPVRNWSSLNGLPLDPGTMDLLQIAAWWGANPSGVAFAQTSINQARVACALERSRLATGTYPETLDQLIPTLLDRVPRDSISGRPILYERLTNDNFILRALGQNQTNDRTNKFSDDWLWTYPTNSPNAKFPPS